MMAHNYFFMIGIKKKSDSNEITYYVIEGTKCVRVIFDEEASSVERIEDFDGDDFSKREREAYDDPILERIDEDDIPEKVRKKVKEY